jgi:glycosyltransferase involved in cell wall biosynthesis
MVKTLVVFVNDFISVLAQKGELIERLYNPGNLFEEVHIILTNNDSPKISEIQKTVGSAKLYIHNLPPPPFKYTLGWQSVFLQPWVKKAVALIRSIQPGLIRCQGFNIHSYLAGKIKEATRIPTVVSLHGNPDVDYLRLCKTFQESYYVNRWKTLAESQLHNFDHIIAVYSPILPYLEQKGLTKFSVIYNIVGLGAQPKKDYSMHGPLKLISIGRQTINQKDQRDMIRAVSGFSNVHLYLIGNGDLHAKLKALINELNFNDRVFLIPNLSNEEIMNTMKDYDVYVYNSINYEISKTVMEAALVGLPIIHNTRVPYLSNELEQLNIIKVENSVEGYQKGYKLMLDNRQLRKSMGQNSKTVAESLWNPGLVEEKIISLYRNQIGEE